MTRTRTRTRTLLFLAAMSAAACGKSGASAHDAGAADSTAFAVATDFATAGVAGTVTVPGLEVTQDALGGVASTDPVIRRFGETIYIVNRFGADNVTIVNAQTLSLVDQISTGSGSNPQDVAVRGDKIYVAALGSAGVLVLDTSNPGADPAEIDLSSLDPDDGKPNCSSLLLSGADLFVACGVLDDGDQFLTPRGPGQIAVIDTADDSVADTFALENKRPVGFLQPTPAGGAFGGDLLIATVPDFADPTRGCLERIGTDRSAGGCLVQNADLGGYASAYRYDGGRLWIAITTGFDPDDYGPLGEVRPFEDGGLGAALTSSEERPFDLALCPSGHLVVADAAGGLRVFAPGGDELTTDPLDLGMPPVSNGVTCF